MFRWIDADILDFWPSPPRDKIAAPALQRGRSPDFHWYFRGMQGAKLGCELAAPMQNLDDRLSGER